MRSRYLAATSIAVLLCLDATLVRAQVIGISGGASTAYASQGGTIVIHGQQTETSVGAGLLNGHFGIGGLTVRRIHGGTMSLGQQGFSLQVPTDLFDGGYIFFGNGLGVHRSFGKQQDLTGFVGTASQEGGSPLFRTADLGHVTAFGQWKQPLSNHCFSLATALLSTANALLESVQCSTRPWLTFAGTAGAGGGAPYAAGSAILKQRRFDLRASYIYAGPNFARGTESGQLTPEPIRENIAGEFRPTRRLSVSLLHENYLLPAASGLTFSPSVQGQQSSLDEGSLYWHGRLTGFSASLLGSSLRPQPILSSGSSLALSSNFYRSFGRIQWNETLLAAVRGSQGGNLTVINGCSVDVNSHLKVTESANVAATGTTFSHGGALLTSFSSFEVDYQLLYLPARPSQPFQQSMVFDAQTRLFRILSLHASSLVGPTGRTLYTFQLGTLFTRATPLSGTVAPTSLGENVLHGRVVDLAGAPVEGAALLIDSEHLYTDSSGYFFFRERRAAIHPLQVLTEEFLSSSDYSVVSAPATVRTATEQQGQLIRIVVARRSPDTLARQAVGTGSQPVLRGPGSKEGP